MKLSALLGLLLSSLTAAAFAGDRRHLEGELDIFAAAFFDDIQGLSISDNREYCGYLGIDAGGDLAATIPMRGMVDSCEAAEPPAGFEILASYHTHGAYTVEADTEVPSVDDMLADIDEDIDGYIATPSGRLWIVLHEEGAATMLCGPGCVTADRRFRECAAYPPRTRYTLAGLEWREEQDPGTC